MAEFVARAGHGAGTVTGPLYLLLFPIPVVCFTAALVSDLGYEATEFLMYLHFSEWLIAGGLAFGALAALVLLIEFFGRRLMRATGLGWAHLVLFFASLIAELCNAFVHSIDGWTAVVPTGLTLSVIGLILALAAVATLLLLPVAWVVRRSV